MSSIATRENFQLLKEMFPDKDETELIEALRHYPGNKIEGLIERLINNGMATCGICLENFIPEELVYCDRGHPFCYDCTSKGIETQLGDGAEYYKCFHPECEVLFDIPILEKVMEPKLFSKYVQRICLNEIKSCRDLNLTSCPECDFSFILDDPDGEVIECQYTYCGAISCIYCRKRAHPAGEICDLNEKKRIDLENTMAEAVIRKCYDCGKPFTKTEGCNRITCVCGAQMCYVCKKRIKPNYDHFYNPPEQPSRGKCPLQADPDELHRVERHSAAKEAESRLGAFGNIVKKLVN